MSLYWENGARCPEFQALLSRQQHMRDLRLSRFLYSLCVTTPVMHGPCGWTMEMDRRIISSGAMIYFIPLCGPCIQSNGCWSFKQSLISSRDPAFRDIRQAHKLDIQFHGQTLEFTFPCAHKPLRMSTDNLAAGFAVGVQAFANDSLIRLYRSEPVKVLTMILAARRCRVRHPPAELWTLMLDEFFSPGYM